MTLLRQLRAMGGIRVSLTAFCSVDMGSVTGVLGHIAAYTRRSGAIEEPRIHSKEVYTWSSRREYSKRPSKPRKTFPRQTKGSTKTTKRGGDRNERIPTSLLPVVSIVGRPNVGKSALFNRLLKKRVSIVRDTPLGHVTRDYQEGRALLADLPFLAIDTSGLEPHYPRESIQMRATSLTREILLRSDVIIFLLDGKDGVLAADRSLSSWFRCAGSEVVDAILPVLNKCEKGGAVVGMAGDVDGMGFGDFVAVSAETGEGMVDLYESLRCRLDGMLQDRLESLKSLGSAVNDEDSERGYGNNNDFSSSVPKVAIMGLTNVGKSTLINQLVGYSRCITGPEPGLTRDAITVELEVDGKTVMEVIDTAGWIKKTRLKAHDDSQGAVAEMTIREGKTVLRFVHVVLLVVDCSRMVGRERVTGLTHAEASLAAEVVSQGRSLVVGLNKVDVCSAVQYQEVLERVQSDMERVTPELGEGLIVPLSARDGVGVDDVVTAIQDSYKTWNRRIPTAKLNKWLRDLSREKAHAGGGNSVSCIKYLSQVKSRPPTFVAFVSSKTKLKDSVQRFVCNRLRDDFDLHGVPTRLVTRQ
jgi:ribosome-associated GTPase EngA